MAWELGCAASHAAAVSMRACKSALGVSPLTFEPSTSTVVPSGAWGPTAPPTMQSVSPTTAKRPSPYRKVKTPRRIRSPRTRPSTFHKRLPKMPKIARAENTSWPGLWMPARYDGTKDNRISKSPMHTPPRTRSWTPRRAGCPKTRRKPPKSNSALPKSGTGKSPSETRKDACAK